MPRLQRIAVGAGRQASTTSIYRNIVQVGSLVPDSFLPSIFAPTQKKLLAWTGGYLQATVSSLFTIDWRNNSNGNNTHPQAKRIQLHIITKTTKTARTILLVQQQQQATDLGQHVHHASRTAQNSLPALPGRSDRTRGADRIRPHLPAFCNLIIIRIRPGRKQPQHVGQADPRQPGGCHGDSRCHAQCGHLLGAVQALRPHSCRRTRDRG